MSHRRFMPAILAVAALAVLSAACSKGTATTTPPTSAPTSGATSAPTSGATSAPTSGSSGSTPAGDTSIPPVTDAAAVRDQLLQMAKEYQFTPDNKDFDLVYAWQQAFPNMKTGPFDFSDATPDTFSFGMSYTFPHDSKESHGYDQVMGIAVMDQGGTCAGGAVVIPQAGDFTPAADGALPTVFVPVDMSNAKKCTAEVAKDTYGRS